MSDKSGLVVRDTDSRVRLHPLAEQESNSLDNHQVSNQRLKFFATLGIKQRRAIAHSNAISQSGILRQLGFRKSGPLDRPRLRPTCGRAERRGNLRAERLTGRECCIFIDGATHIVADGLGEIYGLGKGGRDSAVGGQDESGSQGAECWE